MVKIPLDELWNANDYHNFIKIVGFAAGCMDENASAEMKELYKQSASMCELFLKAYNQKIENK